MGPQPAFSIGARCLYEIHGAFEMNMNAANTAMYCILHFSELCNCRLEVFEFKTREAKKNNNVKNKHINRNNNLNGM